MNPRSSDEEKCLIPRARTLNAAQYAASPIQQPSGGSSATPGNSNHSPPGVSTIRPTGSETSPAISSSSEKRSISRSDVFPSDVPKKLWAIFLSKVAPILPPLVIETEKLNTTLRVAINHGQAGYDTIDPTLGLCLAIGSLQSRDPQLRDSSKWYEKARDKLNVVTPTDMSIGYFQARFLQVKYLQMSGDLSNAWSILYLSIGEVRNLGKPYDHAESNKDTQNRVQVIRQIIWMMRPFLALQLGYTNEPLKALYGTKPPDRLWIEHQLEPLVSYKSRGQATSAFFFACISLAGFIADLVKLETDLRLTRSGCPWKWISTLEVDQLLALECRMDDWQRGLPRCLEWNGHGVDSLLESDVHVRRMRVQTYLGYLYFQLRQYRCCLILNMRLLCDCKEHEAHISRESMAKDKKRGTLNVIRTLAVCCVETAQSIINILWKPSGNGTDDNLGDMVSSERVDIIYAAALVFIACRAIPFSIKDRALGVGFHVPDSKKSVTSFTQQIKKADIMLRNCEDACDQIHNFGERIRRSRAFIDLVSCQSTSLMEEGICGIVSDGMLSTGKSVWVNLYERLGVRFRPDDTDTQVTGMDLLFCWVETLPIDFSG